MSAEDNAFGRGTRRKKFAGYLKAANELRQSYTAAYLGTNTRSEFEEDDEGDIPGTFPNLKVSKSGNEELILFPSYARRHTKRAAPDYPISTNLQDANGTTDAEYWRREWEVYEDANAIVDVDVRGWIYTPHRGPMNRKNRILLGIARHLSGIPAPASGNIETTRHEDKIAEREARDIDRRGKEEADVAGRGGYSESLYSLSASSSRSASPRPGHLPHPITNSSFADDPPGPGYIKKATSWTSTNTDLSPEELAVANTQLLKRLKPFFTTPAMNMSITVFYYNDDTSQSRTTHTNDSGHFNFRAALDFIPTHVRVLASEELSASSEVIITEPGGISLISDIDDTIKHSAIGMGAREIFRNAFVRDLSELIIPGVRELYHKMVDMGVKIHYVSNSPWQMYPLLVSYFSLAGLPAGSFHLKQYTGMLQGIFEPVAERKKATLDRIMNDFPERRFVLVGDSGEADLELYTETALRDPKRVLAIYIRDVSTSQTPGFFDSSRAGGISRTSSPAPFKDRPSKQDSLEGPAPAEPSVPVQPETEDLMSFSDEESNESTAGLGTQTSKDSRARPQRPSKPLALRSVSSNSAQSVPTDDKSKRPPPPPPSRKPTHDAISQPDSSITDKVKTIYNSLPSSSDLWNGGDESKQIPDTASSSSNPKSTQLQDRRKPPPVPPRRAITAYPAVAASYASTRVAAYLNGTDPPDNSSTSTAVNKREELWNRRLARARESLQGTGVLLKTWRTGDDIEKDLVALVRQYMKR